MSNTLKHAEQPCDSSANPCGGMELKLSPRERDLDGISVRRLLPTARRKMVGPWIFFDHFGPTTFAPGQGINVRPHPHIGIATVSYLFAGEILHRDSLGCVQAIRPGDLNLMVSGQGIVHSERERAEVTATEHELHGLQLWLALPDTDEEAAPAFHHYPQTDIPSTDVDGVTVRVMMGAAFGVQSPVKQFSETLYAEAFMTQGQQLTMPMAAERAVYVVSGELQLAGTVIEQNAMAILTAGADVSLQASIDTRIAIVGGEPIGKRFIDWNFVSSRKERIEQANSDWREGRFAKVPGDADEFIPLPG